MEGCRWIFEYLRTWTVRHIHCLGVPAMTRTSIMANVLTALTATVALNACVITTDGDSSFTVDNRSDYALYEIYLAAVNDQSWGPDLLRGGTLFPGESLQIHGVNCGTYDALILDELGAECELNYIDICYDDARWRITNILLSTGPIF
jgi:hypothetical protein